jgi:O-antigen/teichoic acid export membrane protein
LVFVGTQGDDIFVSKYLGFAALGLYQMAYSVSNLPATQITHVISRVTFPAYSRLLSEPERLRAAFQRVLRGTMLLAAPLSVIIWFLIPDYVRYVVSSKWQPIVPLVRILVVAGLVRSLAATGGALFQAMARPDLDFRMQLPRFVVLVGAIWPASKYLGVAGVCWVCLASILGCLPQWFLGLRLLVDFRARDVARACAPGFLVAGGLAVLLGLADLAPSVYSRLAAVAVWAVLVWRGSSTLGLDVPAELRMLLGRGPSAAIGDETSAPEPPSGGAPST